MNMRATLSIPLIQPSALPARGLLVGWSLESRRPHRPIGFTYGDPLKNPSTGYLEPILLEGEGHLMTIAPTGAGKGTGCVIPALLRYPGPVIVVDPKGENVAITARRRREMGHEVVVIDPMGVTDQPSGLLNPLDAIDVRHASAVDDVAALVQMLNEGDGDPRNRFWSSRASHLVMGAILQVLMDADPGKATLLQARDLINNLMSDSEGARQRFLQSAHPEVMRMAGLLGISAPETLGGIVSFAQDTLDFLRGDRVQTSLSGTSFDLQQVTSGAPMSIYLVLPPHMLESHSRLLRLWLGTLLTCITRRRARPPLSTLFILDEAAQLGELAEFRQAITLLRGYGLQTWSFWQDASQLQLLYPKDWKTMVNNCRVLQCFGALNQTAAEGMSELTGFADGAQVLDLAPDEMVLQLAGDEAVVAQLPSYLKDPAFAGQYDPNPYHDPDRQILPVNALPQRMYVRPGRVRQMPGLGFLPKEDTMLQQLLARWTQA